MREKENREVRPSRMSPLEVMLCQVGLQESHVPSNDIMCHLMVWTYPWNCCPSDPGPRVRGMGTFLVVKHIIQNHKGEAEWLREWPRKNITEKCSKPESLSPADMFCVDEFVCVMTRPMMRCLPSICSLNKYSQKWHGLGFSPVAPAPLQCEGTRLNFCCRNWSNSHFNCFLILFHIYLTFSLLICEYIDYRDFYCCNKKSKSSLGKFWPD